MKSTFTNDNTGYSEFRGYIKNNITTDYADYVDFQDYMRNTFPKVRVQKW